MKIARQSCGSFSCQMYDSTFRGERFSYIIFFMEGALGRRAHIARGFAGIAAADLLMKRLQIVPQYLRSMVSYYITF